MNAASKWQRVRDAGLKRTDDFFAGSWYWRFRRWFAERRLAKKLTDHGDVSMEARTATERVRRLQFAVEYWGAVPGPIMRVVREATARGVPRDDTKLMVLNKDLTMKGNHAEVRRSPFIKAVCHILSSVFNTLLVTHFVLLCALIAFAHGPLSIKAILLCAITLIYSALCRGWTLYTSRAVGALSRSGDTVAAISKEIR